MTQQKANAIARKIAKKLFTDANGKPVTRLRLEINGKQDGSGWGESAVAGLLAAELITATNP